MQVRRLRHSVRWLMVTVNLTGFSTNASIYTCTYACTHRKINSLGIVTDKPA